MSVFPWSGRQKVLRKFFVSSKNARFYLMCRQPNLHELARKFDARNLRKKLAQFSWLCVTTISTRQRAPVSGRRSVRRRRRRGRWRRCAASPAAAGTWETPTRRWSASPLYDAGHVTNDRQKTVFCFRRRTAVNRKWMRRCCCSEVSPRASSASPTPTLPSQIERDAARVTPQPTATDIQLHRPPAEHARSTQLRSACATTLLAVWTEAVPLQCIEPRSCRTNSTKAPYCCSD